MMYKVGYHLASSNDYVDYTKAKAKSDLAGIVEILHRMQSPEDCVYVYLPESRIRLEFAVTANGRIVFEIQDSSIGGNYFKEFRLEEIGGLIEELQDVLGKPEDYGFAYEAW